MVATHLLGKFLVLRGGQELMSGQTGKVVELFSYILIKRQQRLQREALSEALWGEAAGQSGRKYLRQALWQLQVALDPGHGRRGGGDAPLLLVDDDSVRINPAADLWLDTQAFEDGCAAVAGIAPTDFTAAQRRELEQTVDLYRGELLQGWYQDWCLFERERLQLLYLTALDKLIRHCELHQAYEAGLDFGERVLRCDRAHERTHRRLMRLQYAAGDRTGALRQYDRCVAALADELGIRPSRKTRLLYEQIRSEDLHTHLAEAVLPCRFEDPDRADLAARLKDMASMLLSVQKQLLRDIEFLERGRTTGV